MKGKVSSQALSSLEQWEHQASRYFPVDGISWQREHHTTQQTHVAQTSWEPRPSAHRARPRPPLHLQEKSPGAGTAYIVFAEMQDAAPTHTDPTCPHLWWKVHMTTRGWLQPPWQSRAAQTSRLPPTTQDTDLWQHVLGVLTLGVRMSPCTCPGLHCVSGSQVHFILLYVQVHFSEFSFQTAAAIDARGTPPLQGS